MLESLKKMFSRPGPRQELGEMADWARRLGHGFKRARGNGGFVIEGLLEGRPWRGEWGAPQREYIVGHELRLRMELDLPSDAQMLLLSRPLMDRLERQTFEEFTDNVQTQIGTKTPEEMRWLVMFPKVPLGSVKVLRGRFGAVASQPETGLAWIQGPLANMLDSVSDDLLRDDAPFVLMTLRGRAYLRLQLDAPDPRRVATALGLFETAVTQALVAVGGPVERHVESGSSRSTAWQSFPPDPPKSR
ncbi:MAG: hypothetical protein M3O01_08320 [Pseudomonadota bacterium]|nr:hypothetical protein [Pseudomonadota bacterium]